MGLEDLGSSLLIIDYTPDDDRPHGFNHLFHQRGTRIDVCMPSPFLELEKVDHDIATRTLQQNPIKTP